MPYRGIDSTYSDRWCSSGEIQYDENGVATGVIGNGTMCNHYEAEDRMHIPPMKEQVRATLEFLAKDDDGFFMMYEQGDVSVLPVTFNLFLTLFDSD